MALPKLDVPTYELELPLCKKKIKYRPFLVKEQKLLFMALESGDAPTIQHNIRELLNACVLSDGFNIDTTPIVDIEYLFLNLRSKSVGEVVQSKYRCNNLVNDVECGNIMETNINLADIKPTESTVSPEIQLTDKVSIKMKYPEFSIVKNSIDIENITEVTFKMIAESIEYIYDGEQMYYAREAQPGEMLEFVENLNQEQFNKLENFFNDLPRLKTNVDMVCKKCGFNHSFEVEGLESFFG